MSTTTAMNTLLHGACLSLAATAVLAQPAPAALEQKAPAALAAQDPAAGVQKAFAAEAQKKLLWGDTHLHTSYSADAYLDGNFTVDPATAYRYAQGLPVIHPYHHARVQIETPLDFLAVTDHAEFLGGIRQVHKYGIDKSGMGLIDKVVAWGAEQMFDYVLADGHGMGFFQSFSSTPMDPRENAAQLHAGEMYTIPGQAKLVANAWRETAQTADANNKPGEFTALIGWEWTSAPGGANLHRIVLTDGDAAAAVTYTPFNRDDSPYPEDLWHWLEQTSAATGDRFIAIPHNSNVSKGFMFGLDTLRGEKFTPQYLQLRRAWEPVVEATQTKGDSETFPTLSPDDAFADFERYTNYIQAYPTPYQPGEGDFVRSGLRRGLVIAREYGVNPYQFGLIGGTDSHTGLSSAEEKNFHGEQPADSIPANKPRPAGDNDAERDIDKASEDDGATGWDMSASGRAAVWAAENTREAILDAFAQREVYATTGPRIVVRFDGGWYSPLTVSPATTSNRASRSDAHSEAFVPMGADLPLPAPPQQVPGFAVSAMKDPNGANLDRIQIIKGWVDAQGNSHERIFDVAWSAPRALDAHGTLPAVGNTVDSKTASYTNSIGAPTLEALWQDPAFDPQQAAFYYARVLEIPTPRHSLYDAVALSENVQTGQPDSLQERAYTSPIWYQPPATGH
jgi:hypothetical protein